jgi:ABC-2 type transport system ATP-binding protein
MLQVWQLEKIIEGHSVLTIEQLDVHAGEVVAVLGPAHSGKTTLLRVLAGLTPPSGGSVRLAGRALSQQTAASARIGVLFEEDLLYERLTVRRNLEFSCQVQGLPASRAAEMLTLLGLSDQAQKPITRLSPGMQRRVAFARALLGWPALLLLDQPALRSDLETQLLFARLAGQAAQEGAAVVTTDEDLFWASKCCSRVVELEDGRIVNAYALLTNSARQEKEPEAAAQERLVPFKVPARRDDRILLFDPSQILYATSREGKTYLHTTGEEATTNLTLQELEGRLTGRGFFKAHRAYLVNLQYIKAVIQFTRNSYTLQLSDQAETMIPLSKQSEKELQDLLGY